MLASSRWLILRLPSVDRFSREEQDEFFGPAVGAARMWFLTMEHMSIQRMEHVGIVVDDLAAATEFFVELGLVRQGEGTAEGRWVDRVVGLKGVRADIAMMQTPDGHSRLELTKFHSPSMQGENRLAPANTPGLRHVAFAVEDLDVSLQNFASLGLTAYARAQRPLEVDCCC
jgi:Glyoxalase/Bleomycin resistance protein/Dioxygenase superfamily